MSTHSAKTRVAAIVVSYNTRNTTLRCLAALQAEALSTPSLQLDAWIVDNDSKDDSVAAIRKKFSETKIIANIENVGFGRANNQAMRQSDAEYFLLINSDAFLLPGALAVLVEYLEMHPKTAIVGPKLLNADGSLQPSCWKFPSPGRVWLENFGIAARFPHSHPLGDYARWRHDFEREVDFVSGACFLVRREAYQESDGFDEAFFLYAEETDWQKRLCDDGWKIAFTPRAQAMHLGGASGANNPITRRKFFDGLDRYTRKHHGAPGVLLMRAGMVAGCFVRAAMNTILQCVPSRRAFAKEKARLHWWLFWRQLTHWKLP